MKYSIILFLVGIARIAGYAQPDTMIVAGDTAAVYIQSIGREFVYFKTNENGPERRIEKKNCSVKQKFPVDRFDQLEMVTDGVYRIRQVVQFPSYSKDQLYTAYRVWFSEMFGDAREVLTMEDKPEGILVGKGIYNGIEVTIKVEARDQRIRFTISNMHFADPAYHYVNTQYAIEKCYKPTGELRSALHYYENLQRIVNSTIAMRELISTVQVEKLLLEDDEW